jgi:hypothetical protein
MDLMQEQGILKLQEMKAECTMSSACRCENESEKLDKESILDHNKKKVLMAVQILKLTVFARNS